MGMGNDALNFGIGIFKQRQKLFSTMSVSNVGE